MKIKRLSHTIIISVLGFGTTILAQETPDNEHVQNPGHHKKEAGPNGGRIVEGEGFKLEFFVKEDRKVQIAFLDHHNKIVPQKQESVSLIGGSRSDPTHLTFEQDGLVLLSQGTLPDIKNIPAILSVKATNEAKPFRERFNVNMSTCPECSLQEYACVCGHEEEE